MTPTDIIQKVLGETRAMSRPAYRGQAKAGWKLYSGAVHRLKTTYGDQIFDDKNELRKRVSEYHNDLILRMEVIDGERMSDLQRLSVLQHQGAATGLLDFTESPLVALWFACSEKPSKDGKVFILDIGDYQVAVNGRLLEEEDLFNTERVVYYEPDRSLGARIVAQQSVFVICNPPRIPDWRLRSVVVPKKLKESIKEHLARVGLSERVMFGDVPGLARANTRRKPLPRKETLAPKYYRDRGHRAYQAERYADALTHYQYYAEALPDVAQPHCLIGDTLTALGRFQEAIDAYTRAIKRIARPIALGQGVIVNRETVERFMFQALYYNRGNAHAATGHHAQAITDYDSALKYGLRRNVLFNRGNSKFGLDRFADAFSDFKAVWSDREGSDAALAMGNCKVMLGEFAEGLRRYLDGISVAEPENSAAHCRQNAEHLRQLLDALGERDHQIKHEGQMVSVEAECEAATFPFAGNPGNVGNTPSGMVNARGGKGYGGSRGFSVILVPRQT